MKNPNRPTWPMFWFNEPANLGQFGTGSGPVRWTGSEPAMSIPVLIPAAVLLQGQALPAVGSWLCIKPLEQPLFQPLYRNRIARPGALRGQRCCPRRRGEPRGDRGAAPRPAALDPANTAPRQPQCHRKPPPKIVLHTTIISIRTTMAEEEVEAVELVLFQVSECYVYMIPPRKTAASYRADEWNVNKWSWEGTLKVISKGVECIIRLEDKQTGELYARAFLREGEPHPVEPVIDSSRYFVLRVEENIDGRLRHAFIGVGFRERTEAYDFQAALHDHMKYLNKKKTAEEMEQQYQHTSSVDYSLKDGETLVLQLKNKGSGGNSSSIKAKLNNLSLEEKVKSQESSIVGLKLPPPPPSPVSPVAAVMGKSPSEFSRDENFEMKDSEKEPQDTPNDDFGDFQAAG
ncbi:adaptin ear-binding coat-associated protein 1 [Striga asiatica]|uniref:Adaptin ear-binding coat-associated protein 1 n=1 Tax=Striga asiatica TaxID=4170 RepID=A0A5A7PSB9_STRAF|nr:adaptin ear-binding coat-associated protein 1 [Striga asiatica]